MNVERDSLTELVIGKAIEVHRALGPGLLESAYEECLCHELEQENVPYERQVEFPLRYKGRALDCGYRIDVLLPGALILEIKAVSELLPIHEAQLLTYMKLTKIKLGLLLNFNVTLLKDGIKRMVL